MFWAVLALTSAVFSAAAAVMEKKILITEDAVPFSFVFSVITAVITLPFLYGTDWASLSGMGVAVLFLKTALGSAAFLFVMQSIKRLELSGALPMLALTPGLVAVGGLVLLGEKLSARETAGLAVMLCGTYMLQVDDKIRLWEPFAKLFKSTGYRYILGALAIFAATSLLDKVVVRNYRMPPMVVVGLGQLFQALCFWVVFMAQGRRHADGVDIARRWGGLLLALGVTTAIYRWTQIEAVKLAPVALVLALKRTSVFMGTAAGGRFFNERNVLRKSTAAAIIVAGAFLIMNNAG